MKLNLYTIAHELGTLVAGSSLHSNCNDPRLDYPILFSAGDHRYCDNVLHVAASKHLQETKDRVKRYLSRNPNITFSCVCVGEPPTFYREAKNCDIVWIDPNRSRTETFNAIQKIFQRYNAWEKELDLIVDRGGELSDLVNSSLKIFKNDLCITDPLSRVLVHRVYRNERLTKEQTDLIKEGDYLSKNMMFDGMEDERNGQDFASFAPTFATMHAFHCTVLRSAIKVSPNYSLILSVHPNYQDVGAKDCAPALMLATALKKICTNLNSAGESNPYVSVYATFKALVQGKQVPDADLVQCAITLGWNREIDEYLCFCADLRPSMKTQDGLLISPYASACNRLQSQFECVAFVFDGRVVAVTNLSRSAEESELYDEMEQFAKEYRLAIGASAPYEGLRSLQNSYHQASNALRVCQTTQKHLACFGDHTLDIGMNFIVKEMTPEYFCPRSLIGLAQQNTELYLALKTYLKANCNSNIAAKNLDLQRSSFVYRLEKARRAVSLDLDDPDTRLLLSISIKLIDLYGLGNMDLSTTAKSDPLPLSKSAGNNYPRRR